MKIIDMRKTNKEKALNKLNSAIQIPDDDCIVYLNDAVKCIELASKPDWYKPSDNEFPNTSKAVYGYVKLYGRPDLYTTFLTWDSTGWWSDEFHLECTDNTLEVIKWTYLPEDD